jgi:hypothetical protein
LRQQKHIRRRIVEPGGGWRLRAAKGGMTEHIPELKVIYDNAVYLAQYG